MAIPKWEETTPVIKRPTPPAAKNGAVPKWEETTPIESSPSETFAPEQPSFMSRAISGMNTPALPIKKLGGKLLDTTTRLVGAGEDRGIIKQNLPRFYGAAKSLAGKAEQLTSPVSVGLGLGMAASSPVVATGAAGIFATQALVNLFQTAPQKFQEYKEAIANNDIEKQTEIVTDAGLDATLTLAVGKQFVKNLDMPSIMSAASEIPKGVKNIAGAVNVKTRTEKLASEIPGKIQSRTGVEPLQPTKAGQVIQESFEKGYGGLESQFKKANEAALLAEESAIRQTQSLKQGQVLSGVEKIALKYADSPKTLKEAGLKTQESFDATMSGLKSKADFLYDKLGEVSGKVPAVDASGKNPGLDFIKKVFEQRNISSPNLSSKEALQMQVYAKELQKQYGLSQSQISQVLQQTDDLASSRFTSESLSNQTLMAYKAMNEFASKLANPELTVRDLSLIASDVNRIAYNRSINDPIKNVYKALGGVLREQISDAATKGGFGGLSNSARSLWKKYKTLENSEAAKILSKDPEYIVPKIAKTNSPTRVEELMSSIDPSARNYFKRAVLDDYMLKAGDDIGRLSKLLASKTPETNRAIFGEDAVLIDRYSKLAKLVDDMKFNKPKLSKELPFTPTETRTAAIIREQNAGNIIDTLIGRGIDETGIKAAMNGMDNAGRDALRGGVFNKIKNDPMVLNKISDPILKAIYGKDSVLFTSYRDILNAKNSYLKNGILDDIAKIVIPEWPARWVRRIGQGVTSIGKKVQFPYKMEKQIAEFKDPKLSKELERMAR